MQQQKRDGKLQVEPIVVDCSNWESDVPSSAWSSGQFITGNLPSNLPSATAEQQSPETEPPKSA